MISISYFFNSALSLPELGQAINAEMGCQLVPSPGAPETIHSVFPFFGMELDLTRIVADNPDLTFDDVGDAKFSEYKYELELTTSWGWADVRSIQLPLILCMIRVLFQRLGVTGMLVYDLEILLAKYYSVVDSEGVAQLVDSQDDAIFGEFGVHLEKVRSKIISC